MIAGGRHAAAAAAVERSEGTVARVRKRCAGCGLDGAQEAQLVSLACSAPPDGKARWTLKMLAERLVELEAVDAVSDETVRRVLKQTRSSPG